MSFTDNVQDAALQAGHFNDFAQVVQLRSAIFKALKAAPDQTLTYSTIGESVFKSLDLPFLEFANRDSEPISPRCVGTMSRRSRPSSSTARQLTSAVAGASSCRI